MSRISDLFRFSKPKTPGYGISKGYYLSVLSPAARLPVIREIANTSGADGAVHGFIAPLAQTANHDVLNQPLERGMYAVASPNKKTVLRMAVFNTDEGGFPAESIARILEERGTSPDVTTRIRATWSVCQFTFEAHDPMVVASMRFLQNIVYRLGTLVDGLVADPVSERYEFPAFFKPNFDDSGPVDIKQIVAVHASAADRGVYTLGMQKLGLPEFEMADLDADCVPLATDFLLTCCQAVLRDGVPESGHRLGTGDGQFRIFPGGIDRARWEGIACLGILPEKGDASSTLRAWVSTKK